jgi:Ni/Fe-hydrogenase subunit HybB-like protein
MKGSGGLQLVAAGPSREAIGPSQGLFRFLRSELRPRGRLLTPFNIISAPIILVAMAVVVWRFIGGLGAVTHGAQDTPWGLWIGFNVVTGVAFAGGAYVITFMVYILHAETYRPIVRATVLNGFLAYVFYAGALALDVGRPWKMINPIIGNSFGYSSVLFLVAWHFLLYMMAQAIEFSPAVAEWLGLKRARKALHWFTLGAVIFGIALSILHQSGLGALFLMAKPKIHPLWYSEFLPILFLASSVFAGLSIVLVEGFISQRVFSGQLGPAHRRSRERIVLGLGKICAGAMFAYLFLKLLDFIHGQEWVYLGTGWGAWYLVEVVGFVALPMVLFFAGVQKGSVRMIQAAAIPTIIGIILNRLNVSMIAFKWYAAEREWPTWQEIVVALAIIFVSIWVFRWVVHRMPVLRDQPAWALAGKGRRLAKEQDLRPAHAMDAG